MAKINRNKDLFPKQDVVGEPESIEVMVILYDHEEHFKGYYDYDERAWYVHYGGMTVGHRKIDDSDDIEGWYEVAIPIESPTSTDTGQPISSTNSEVGSYHWFHTLIARQKNIGEYLKGKTPTEEILREWGKVLYDASKELELGFKAINYEHLFAESKLFKTQPPSHTEELSREGYTLAQLIEWTELLGEMGWYKVKGGRWEHADEHGFFETTKDIVEHYINGLPTPQPVTGEGEIHKDFENYSTRPAAVNSGREGEVTALTAIQELIEFGWQNLDSNPMSIIRKAEQLLAKESEDKKNEAIAFAEWLGGQGLFNGLSPDNIRRWHKMVGNSKARTTEELYKDFINAKS